MGFSFFIRIHCSPMNPLIGYEALCSFLFTCLKCFYSQIFLNMFIRIQFRRVFLVDRCLLNSSCELILSELDIRKINYDQDVDNWFDWECQTCIESEAKIEIRQFKIEIQFSRPRLIVDDLEVKQPSIVEFWKSISIVFGVNFDSAQLKFDVVVWFRR